MSGTPQTEAHRHADGGGRRRSPWPLAVVAALFVIVPFLAWYGTWFGRALSDEQVEEYLRDDEKPRHAQHALSQVAERVERGDHGVVRFYPQVLRLAASQVTDLRMTAAWVMGVEHTSEEFRAALLRLLEDPEPVVRRNAALALVRFGDARSRTELLAMLRPYAVVSSADGTASTVLSKGTEVTRGALMARVESGVGESAEVRAPLPGKVEEVLVAEGEALSKGRQLFTLAPDAAQVRDALIGLAYFGGAEDLPEIERYTGGVEGMPEEVKRQAALTAEAVKRRTRQGR